MLTFKKIIESATAIDKKTSPRKGLFAKCCRKLTSIFVINQDKPTNNNKDIQVLNKQEQEEEEHNSADIIIQPISIKQDDWKLSILTELNLLHDENRDINSDQQQMLIMNTCQPMERKQDLIKQKLDIAAARRNEIKENRLREQMDTALFETMRLLRQQEFEKEDNYLSRRPSLPICQL